MLEDYKNPDFSHEMLRKNLADKFMDNFPIYALGYNPFVSLKQAASFLLTNPEIDPKYYKGLKDIREIYQLATQKGFKKWAEEGNLNKLHEIDEIVKEFYEVSPMLYARLQGKIFREIGEVTDAEKNPITGEDVYSGVMAFGKGLKTNKFLRKNRSLEWISLVDMLTVSQIYRATKAEMLDKHPNLSEGEIRNKAARKAEWIIYKTQPTFNSLWSSKFRQSNNLLTRGLTMFAAQPHKNYNYAVESMFDYHFNGKEAFADKARKANISAFVYQPLALAMLGLPLTMYNHALFGKDDDSAYGAVLGDAVQRSINTVVGGKVAYELGRRMSGKEFRFSYLNPLAGLANDINVITSSDPRIKDAQQTQAFLRAIGKAGGLPLTTIQQAIKPMYIENKNYEKKGI